ncbi:hypothetical protein [Micromonospora sp. NBRC 107095]|uniref:coiled-coil domain-containing protein n=1 Tax=Micromonospora sp. NBRC 107095 TaxID=3032209 RepID=UPI0024A0FD70|nr:hypothetical protein [Micromonospora sp. NBRC 107095]GLZ57414.1 hypothetical protein Misp05_09900 [Micromonospora sp. NBRC 107095]
MIERGTGRTSGLTDWHLMDVNSMWACLQDHDTANHWKQVAGWRKVCDLAQTHLGRLQQYRRGLAEAWPPETSAASRTYLAELDELIDKVQRTHDAAAANYTALSAATQAIGTTRAALRKIHEEYATKYQQKQAYEAMVADPKAVMGNRATQPPVADGELEQLNAQARSMMFSLSGELQQAQATLQKPPAARPQAGKDVSNPDVYGITPAPIIPPILPAPISSKTNAALSSPKHTAAAPVPIATGNGPILNGTGAGTPLSPTTVAQPNPASNASPPPTFSGVPPVLPPTATHTPVSHQPAGPIGRPGSNGSSVPSRGPGPDPTRVMPPGGVIGSVPGSLPRQPDSNSVPPRRVNPVGGVIGGGGAGTAPTGAAGSRPSAGRGFSQTQGMPPIGGAPGPWRSGMNRTDYPSRNGGNAKEVDRWDPDNPWETQQGVRPVVRPTDDEGPIDPGPAIGIDR